MYLNIDIFHAQDSKKVEVTCVNNVKKAIKMKGGSDDPHIKSYSVFRLSRAACAICLYTDASVL